MSAARIRLLRSALDRQRLGASIPLDQLAAIMPAYYGAGMILKVEEIRNQRSTEESKRRPVPPGAVAYLSAVDELRKAAIPIDKSWRAACRKGRVLRLTKNVQYNWNQLERSVFDEEAKLADADREQLWHQFSDACPPPECLQVPEYLSKKFALYYEWNGACGKPPVKKLVDAEVRWWIEAAIEEYKAQLQSTPPAPPPISECRTLAPHPATEV